jgi:lipopolysaccharide biosynthesis protein
VTPTPTPAVRPLAFYLPQFHPIPENDEWWGAGYTEWTSVARARPLFRGHYQPQLPADLGFYDLRLPETRAAQAELARAHGVHGFCYYHYWFRGRRLLERPFDDVLASGEPDLPFALCWANEHWTRAWDGRTDEVLVRQEYSEADDREHLRWLLHAFADDRYVRIDGKPVFLVYRASRMPDARRTIDVWREEAAREGMELYLCRVELDAHDQGDPTRLGFDAGVEFQPDFANLGVPLRRSLPARLARRIVSPGSAYRRHRIFDYPAFVDRMLARPRAAYRRFPGVAPGWDNTARRARGGVVFRGSTPAEYERWLHGVIDAFEPFSPEENLLFICAWNEWAEGNHLEPCQRFGRGYLEATLRAVCGR